MPFLPSPGGDPTSLGPPAGAAPALPVGEGQAPGPAAPATPQAMQQQGEDPPQQQRQQQQQQQQEEEGDDQENEDKENPRMVLETTNIPECNARTAKGFHSLIL